MLLSMKKDMKKQVKRVCRQTEKLFKEFGEGKSSAEYDTNVVLIRMDKIENELKELREQVNREKKQIFWVGRGRPAVVLARGKKN